MGTPEMPQQKPDGERWLQILGYEHLKGQPTGYEIDGQPVLAENFDRLCAEHARPIFSALEKIGPNHPKYEQYLDVARKAFDGYFGSQVAE